ncbi:UDP-N-acetylmuramate dehydrogenase [Campylobacter fetus subsp. venerealis]|uniref:UDP-N-acetylmuramate dehydrogenase n=1 Tax=Campylobacter fetus TaxID=196 RepID=UPI0018E8AB03|nr:UDP-N-acetylmuramate dehydrogenase [Campylobacter fetus]QQF52734.1 UDP-N-acetylmuramate dehydrogenase [Campylobacter fetus subsp. venerealis]
MKIDFSKLSSVKIGGIFNVEIIDEIRDFNGVVIGGANNILISPNPPKMGILSSKFDYIKFENGILKVGAKTKTSTLFKFVQEHRLGGFEFIKKIPGTMGGLITMNAGLKEYEISQNLKSVITSYSEFGKNECDFSYRHSSIKGVIYEARFEILREFSDELSLFLNAKRANQPKGASFGSCFTNPKEAPAGKLLEEVGLKGFRIGGCGFSQLHANFLINYGGGTFDDAIALINLAKERVMDKFKIELKSEVVIL